MDNNARNMARS